MDIEGLLRSLNARSARYVVIGAAAFPVHGYARATLDVDLLIEPTFENARRVRQALLGFGYDVSEGELLEKKVLIRQYVLETDIHPFVAGAEFEEVWRRRVEDRIRDTPTAFASLEDLIRMKEAAGRPKDLEGLKALRRIRARSGGTA